MKITLEEFIAKHLGKKLDFDGAFQGQCIDLFRYYVQDVLDFPQPLPVVGAKNLWLNYDIDPSLYNYYDRIPNTIMALPRKGDVPIWKATAGNKYGHVAVWTEGGRLRFKSFDQNNPTLSVCTITEHAYSNLYGWLRPKIIVEPCKELEKENKLLKIDLAVSQNHEKFWFDALKLVALPEDSKWKEYKAGIMDLYASKQKAMDRIKDLEDMIGTNVTGLDSRKDDKYVYGSTELLLELIKRLKGVDSA